MRSWIHGQTHKTIVYSWHRKTLKSLKRTWVLPIGQPDNDNTTLIPSRCWTFWGKIHSLRSHPHQTFQNNHDKANNSRLQSLFSIIFLGESKPLFSPIGQNHGLGRSTPWKKTAEISGTSRNHLLRSLRRCEALLTWRGVKPKFCGDGYPFEAGQAVSGAKDRFAPGNGLDFFLVAWFGMMFVKCSFSWLGFVLMFLLIWCMFLHIFKLFTVIDTCFQEGGKVFSFVWVQFWSLW